MGKVCSFINKKLFIPKPICFAFFLIIFALLALATSIMFLRGIISLVHSVGTANIKEFVEGSLFLIFSIVGILLSEKLGKSF